MYRSFSDRVFGGVCGGVAARLPLNAWLVRVVFLVLAVFSPWSLGALYLMLWFAVPQESLAMRRESGTFWLLMSVLLTGLVAANRIAHPNGSGLFFPLLLFLVSAVFFVEQVRRWAQ